MTGLTTGWFLEKARVRRCGPLVVVMLQLLSLCGPAEGAGADLGLPAQFIAAIEPPEAVQAGARATVDNGSEFGSGEPQSHLFPGSHMVRFRDLPGWDTPEPVSVLGVGGKSTTVKAVYRPKPAYYFREIPEQSVRPSVPLEFLVRSADDTDPQSPPPGTVLTIQLDPRPVGQASFDPATGIFRYVPDPADRLPFSAVFTTPDGLQGSVTISPPGARSLEDSVITYKGPLPDPESRDSMSFTVTSSGTNVFNDAARATFDVDISGHTLILEANHPAHLYEVYNNRKDLTSLRLYADRVIIRSRLSLPQTRVSIHARELRFEGDGVLDTTPVGRGRIPAGVIPDDGLLAGNDGDPGHDGGDLEAFVERFHADPGTSPRIILRGGNGGRAGEGRDGSSDSDPFYAGGGPNWIRLLGRCGIPFCGYSPEGQATMESETTTTNLKLATIVTKNCGAVVVPRGEAAVPSGHPGPAGRGGILRSTLDLRTFASLEGGTNGLPGSDHIGGILVEPFFTMTLSILINRQGVEEERIAEVSDPIPPLPGFDGPAPKAPAVVDGHLEIATNTAVWLHPFALRSILSYAKDCYLQGHLDEARLLLSDYHEVLVSNQTVVESPGDLDDEAFRISVNLDELELETGTVLHRLNSNLDYFGNPVGWAPMLSFEANLLAFENEIEQSVPILYLSYWLHNAATNVQGSVSAAEQARNDLEHELVRLQSAFNDAELAIPRLRAQSSALADKISRTQVDLAATLTSLMQTAQQNVEERHRVPLWKKAAGALAVVADLIPVGQPVVGQIGDGLRLLSQVDPDHPLQSAEAIAPKAMEAFNHQNISLCFSSTNKASTTATNGETKKSLKERLSSLAECGKFVGGELKELAGVFNEAKIDSKEVEAELNKIEASDPAFTTLTEQVKTLNAQKDQFAQQLATTLQSVGTLTSGMAQNVIGTHEITDRLEAGYSVLDHGALLHIQAMERRAKDRLLEYQYLLAQAFQYRLVKPYTGDWQLTRLFDKFRVLVESGTSHLLSQADFAVLKSLFISELQDITHNSFDNNNAPGVTDPVSFRLLPEELRQLNDAGRVMINLKDRGLVGRNLEDVRIADLQVVGMPVHGGGGPGSGHALVKVRFEHSGISRISSRGNTYIFRNYQADTFNPIVWTATYDGLLNTLTNSELSPADQSLISVLLKLDSAPDRDLQFYSLPAAWGDIAVTKEVLTGDGSDITIDDLVVHVKYLARNVTSGVRELSVSSGPNLNPVIVIDHPDINGRLDGAGSFSRMFAQSTQLRIQAPNSYGRYQFDGWQVADRDLTNRSPTLSLFLESNSKVVAKYVLSAEPLRLRIIGTLPGQIRLEFPTVSGSTYTLEAAPELAHPAWTPVDTIVGDGLPAILTRSSRPSAAGFFRVRKAP